MLLGPAEKAEKPPGVKEKEEESRARERGEIPLKEDKKKSGLFGLGKKKKAKGTGAV